MLNTKKEEDFEDYKEFPSPEESPESVYITPSPEIKEENTFSPSKSSRLPPHKQYYAHLMHQMRMNIPLDQLNRTALESAYHYPCYLQAPITCTIFGGITGLTAFYYLKLCLPSKPGRIYFAAAHTIFTLFFLYQGGYYAYKGWKIQEYAKKIMEEKIRTKSEMVYERDFMDIGINSPRKDI